MWVQQEVLSPGHRAPPPHTHTHTQILSQHLPHHPESLPRPVTCRAEGQKQEFITKHHSFALKPAVPPPGSRITQHGSSPGSAAALPHPRLLPTPSTAVPEGEKSGPGPRSEPEPDPVLGSAQPCPAPTSAGLRSLLRPAPQNGGRPPPCPPLTTTGRENGRDVIPGLIPSPSPGPIASGASGARPPSRRHPFQLLDPFLLFPFSPPSPRSPHSEPPLLAMAEVPG